MKLFTCDHCGNIVYFENARCERCGHALGYDPARNALLALPLDSGVWTSAVRPGESLVFCANAAHAACTWLPAQPAFINDLVHRARDWIGAVEDHRAPSCPPTAIPSK